MAKCITAAYLRRLRACEERVKRFEHEWPHGAMITRENILRAIALKLDIEWFAQTVLGPPALATYQAAVAPALATYQAAVGDAFLATLAKHEEK